MFTNVLRMMYFLIKAEHKALDHVNADKLYQARDSDIISDAHFKKLCLKVVNNCHVCKTRATNQAKHEAYLARITAPIQISTSDINLEQITIRYYAVNNNNLVQVVDTENNVPLL